MSKYPYNAEKENKIIAETPSAITAANPKGVYKKRDTPITPYENVKLILDHKTPCWVPVNNEINAITPRIMADNVARAFVMDGEDPAGVPKGGKDYFGIDWVYVPLVGGSMVQPGNPKVTDINEWEKVITFPDLSKLDWEASARANAKLTGDRTRMLEVVIMTGLFERLISFMDFEGAALALVDEEEQDAVHRLFDRLCKFYDELIGHIYDAYHPDMIQFHDDWGSQRAPFFSLSVCREMLVPYLKRIAESCHKRGMYLHLHSCGKNEMLVPAMIESDVDLWYPQPMNDFKRIVNESWGKMVIGVGTPDLASDASDEEILAAAEKHLNEYIETPGYISSATGFARGNKAIAKYQELMYPLSRELYYKL